MNVEAWHREIISGQRRGPIASVSRGLLAAATSVYGFAVARRNRRFDRGIATSHAAPLPVVSVGNIAVGGTGKTPVTAWLAGRLRDMGLRSGILMRGYKAAAGEKNDEHRLLEELLGDDVVIEADRDRFAAARRVAEAGTADVLLLDDGYQHRRLRRDFNLLVIDGVRPFGFGHLLPRGLLREPMRSIHRADAIIVSRRELINDDAFRQIRQAVRPYSDAPVLEARFDGTPDLTARRLLVCSAIGHPDAFRETVAKLGGEVIATLVFPDHYEYTSADVAQIETQVDTEQLDIAVTAKDWVKLKLLTKRPDRYVVVRQQVSLSNPEKLLRLLREAVEKRQAALATT